MYALKMNVPISFTMMEEHGSLIILERVQKKLQLSINLMSSLWTHLTLNTKRMLFPIVFTTMGTLLTVCSILCQNLVSLPSRLGMPPIFTTQGQTWVSTTFVKNYFNYWKITKSPQKFLSMKSLIAVGLNLAPSLSSAKIRVAVVTGMLLQMSSTIKYTNVLWTPKAIILLLFTLMALHNFRIRSLLRPGKLSTVVVSPLPLNATIFNWIL
mmetsp:Transcript_14285/g.13798  ORF Transcript_14285/g.13798 Transcript_14285/m.13798 type:complete len:211 (+) Transcript_14285:1444-2076(+)